MARWGGAHLPQDIPHRQVQGGHLLSSVDFEEHLLNVFLQLAKGLGQRCCQPLSPSAGPGPPTRFSSASEVGWAGAGSVPGWALYLAGCAAGAVPGTAWGPACLALTVIECKGKGDQGGPQHPPHTSGFEHPGWSKLSCPRLGWRPSSGSPHASGGAPCTLRVCMAAPDTPGLARPRF